MRQVHIVDGPISGSKILVLKEDEPPNTYMKLLDEYIPQQSHMTKY